MLPRLLILGLSAMLSWSATGEALPPQNATQQPGATPLLINLQDALARAKANSQQFQTANISAQLAHEDRVQGTAGLLPTLNYFNQYIYTQGNGTPPGIFVANDGVHVYNSQALVHGDIYAPGKWADRRRLIAAEAVARAKADIAARGLVVTVVQSFYGLLAAQHKDSNARQSLREAQQFFDITQKQEQGGEAAHSDVVKAQIQLEQRQRDAQEAQLTAEKSQVGLAVLIFPDYRKDFSVVDDLDSKTGLPPFSEVQDLAGKNNPDIRAAQAAVQQEKYEVSVARSGFLPSLSFDYFYGIDANQFAVYNHRHLDNLGSVAQAQLTIPVWNWGATRSRLKQAELHLQQAHLDLSLTQRQLLANLDAFYREAEVAGSQLPSLAHTVELAAESLKLTLLRYTAGEVTVLEVVDAQTTLAQARNAHADGWVRYRLALADLQTLTGSF